VQASSRFFVRTRGSVALLFATSGFFVPTIEAAKVDASKLPPPADRKIDFVKDIQPIFANNWTSSTRRGAICLAALPRAVHAWVDRS
jgi:hypothetical protein